MKLTTIAGMLLGSGCLTVLLLIATSRPISSPQQTPGSESKKQVVARVGPRSITLGEAEQYVALPLYQADEQRARLLQQAVQHLIDEELLSSEAARAGVTVQELLERASESESVARLADLPGPLRQAGAEMRKQDTRSPYTPQESARIRQALLVRLRRQADIRLALPEPDLPALTVSSDDDPWTGTADAPVTIIEFSDFECPYCRLSVPVLKELLSKYRGRVKLVYRDFPGPNHPQAQQAALAAQCAAEQGRFWDYHDALFAQKATATGWDFLGLAKKVGLRPEPFATCLKEGRYREEVAKDLQDGLKLGVTSTPTFFVNGRPLVGARPFSDFQALVEKVLSAQSAS